MPITEMDICQWADRHECRDKLPILVRKLIRETTPSLTTIRFPGNEAVDLSGFDGNIENSVATIWVPSGQSIWEMGCNKEPGTKAESDYKKRTAEVPEEERKATGFVFITPRRWQKKKDWLEAKRAENNWGSVRAYDSTDLGTWLEEAPVTSRWLGEMLGVMLPSLLTPYEWWPGWASASEPALTKKLVSSRRHDHRSDLLDKLRRGDSVIPIQADDRKEAVAFVVASLIEESADDILDRTLIATSGGVRIPSGSNRMIVIADVEEGADPDFGDRSNLTIVRPYPKGRSDAREALMLSRVPSEIFRAELEAMGFSRDEAESKAQKSGHSIPVLRRQLSKDQEVRRPSWARGRASAKRLLPFALVGSWIDRESLNDGLVLQLLGELDDGEVARIRDDLLALNDAPIARYGNVNVVVSQLDALFAVGPFIEKQDLDHLFQLLPDILAERDPALDLPQDEWYMANVLGHEHKYSGALLSGLCDGLCILSIYGAEICGNRLNDNLTYRVDRLVRSLMQNVTEERWLTIRHHLRNLAEASPSAFLDCLDEDLGKPEPAIKAIMGSVSGGVSGECLRTDLLWALEALAWHPEHFSRVAEIIFRLRRLEVEDNWCNSPKNTAEALFRAWLPATALGINERMQVLRRLAGNFRGPIMDVCISLLPIDYRTASRTSRPFWRELKVNVSPPQIQMIGTRQ